MYEFESKVRYSEADKNGNLMIHAMANYFQDCSHFETDDLKLGTDYFLEKAEGWFINFWQINILRIPQRGEKIVIGTFPYQVKEITEHRNYYIKNNSGEILVQANSIWSLIDLNEMRILRIPAVVKEKYVFQEKLVMQYHPRRIKIEQGLHFVEIGRHRISRVQLDSNNHLNNAQYIQIALSDIPVSLHTIRQICIEYKKQALNREIIIVNFAEKDSDIFIDLKSEDGASYAIMWLRRESY